MAAKYASLSPYVYCANNPVKLVDPNGEDIEIVTTVDADGKKNITINFTAKIMNKSSHSLKKEELEKMRDDISYGIEKYYSGQFDDATVNVNVDIICSNEEISEDLDKESNRHCIFIVDKCSEGDRIAEAEDFGSYINIRWDIGKGSNNNYLRRTAAHEFGHLLGLPDINTEGNLMESGGSGIILSSDQIQKAVANYRNNKINIGIWFRDFKRQVHSRSLK
jgi:hypothetical protein